MDDEEATSAPGRDDKDAADAVPAIRWHPNKMPWTVVAGIIHEATTSAFPPHHEFCRNCGRPWPCAAIRRVADESGVRL